MARLNGKTAAKGIKKAAKGAASKAKTSVQDMHGPSPNPKTNLVLADIALRGGSMLLRRSVERGLLGMKYDSEKARDIMKGRTIAETLIGTALARVATRSVPGALIIGGGMLAKTLYDRKKGRAKAQAEGEDAFDEMADNAREA